MPRWNGGVIGAANNPTSSSAKGIWSLSEATKAIRAGLWPPSNAGADPYFENVTLLLPGDGTNGAQNNTFLDSSTNNFTITRNGNTTQGTFTPFSKADGRWSNYFDGTGDYLSVSNNALIATGDFTMEAWCYTSRNNAYQGIIGSGDSSNTAGARIVQGNTGNIEFWVNGQSNTATALPLNQWNHVAIVRSGSGSNNISFYLNGTRLAQVTQTSSTSNNTVVVGRYYNNGTDQYHWLGYISNARFVVGSAVYSGSTYTVPTAPLTAITDTQLLTCQSNRFVDNSTNAFAITRNGDVSVQTFSPFPTLTAYAAGTNGGSGYFDGSGDYLSFAADTAFAFGTGDYTVEAWVYFTSITTTDLQIIFMSGSTGGNNFYFHVDGNQISVGTTAAFVSNQATTFTTNQWYHIAACRSGTTLKLFVNGTQAGSNATDSTSWISSGTARVGSNEATTQLVNGYMSGVRVLKGTAQYTANFTPPTAPLTAITNTSLLLSGTNGGIIDTSMSNDLETVGNAQISTTQSKFGGGSISFDGTGDALVVYDPSYENSPGGGDFTFECWVYFNALPGAFSAIYHLKNDASTSTTVFIVEISSTGKLSLSTGIATIIDGTAGLLTTGSWIHIAVTRASGTLRTFINGTQDKSASNTTTYNGSYDLFGVWRYSGSDNYLNAYIDDLRITKGYARYTTNFTAPAGPFIGFGD